MSLPQRNIRLTEPPERPAPKIDRRAKAEYDSHMAMVRHLVDEAENRETGEYLFRGMLQQCKILAKRFDLKVE
jgi:hypothetical protein